jgi:hypothetical protein
MRQVAEIEAKKAADYLRKEKAEQAEKKALLDQLSKPSGLSEDAKKKRAAAGTTFHFVTNGIARTRTGRGCGQGRVDRSGVATGRQFFGLVTSDELHPAIPPVVLGQGEAPIRRRRSRHNPELALGPPAVGLLVYCTRSPRQVARNSTMLAQPSC